jgi:hypothetical protein
MDFVVPAFRYRAGTGLSGTMNPSVLVSAASEHHRDAAAHPAALRWPDRRFHSRGFFVNLRKLVGDQLFVVAANPF